MQPRPPGRLGERGQHRRRRRHHDPGAGPLPARGRPVRPAAGRPVRDRHRVPARRARRRGQGGRDPRRHRRAGGRHRSRLARRPHRPVDARGVGRRRDADLPAVVRREGRPLRHRPRPVGLRRAQARRARGAGVLPVVVGPDRRLQGHAHDAPARGVLPRARGRAGRVRARARALAVLHEHVPELAARAPVPVPRAQRRDQHRHGEPQLDAGTRGAARERRDPRRPGPHLPDLHARCVRHRHLRRGVRAPPPGRAVAAARGPDDDPGGVGEPRLDEPGEARVLPLPRVADGAVGRSRVDRVHRRHRDGCGARPQRAAPQPLLGDERRPRDHGERGRRARRPVVRGREEGPPGAGPHVPRRHDPGSDRRRRGAEGGPRGRRAVPRMARRRARAPRRPAAA